MQFLLFIISIAVGSRMIYQFNRASWLVNMNQVSCSCLERVRHCKFLSLITVPSIGHNMDLHNHSARVNSRIPQSRGSGCVRLVEKS